MLTTERLDAANYLVRAGQRTLGTVYNYRGAWHWNTRYYGCEIPYQTPEAAAKALGEYVGGVGG